eukprot:TRINITY_DN64635_c0_g1_i1.p1 TRINITY_DN64635_c0_g1~~TRINITY_DN64635_c0_g1_i1.p1  ORF type:complete len:706 (+),score=214.45 TRINITY_DN64635_c0_g1_i1:82-2199(+)
MARSTLALCVGLASVNPSFGHSLVGDAAKQDRPVNKVLDLLKAMSTKLDEEQSRDKELKDAMDCWCKQNNEDKTKAIAEGKEKIEMLDARMKENVALAESLAPQIRTHTKELNGAKATLDKAFAIRQHQIKSFQEDEQSLLDSISGVADAKEALTGKSFVQLSQMSSLALNRIGKRLQRVLDTQAARLVNVLSRSDRSNLDTFLKDLKSIKKGKSFLQAASAEMDPSDSIVGILVAMADDFAADLQQELDEEKENKKAYEELTASKQKEVNALQDSITQKTQAKGKAEQVAASSKKDLGLAKKTLAEDEKFQKAVESKCVQGDGDYEQRQKTRGEEIVAVSKTIDILTSDSARDLLASNSISFFQENSIASSQTISDAEYSKRQQLISDLLNSEGTRLGAAALVTLSMDIKLNSFTKVKKAIDDMVTSLKKEQADEVQEKDLCVKDLNTNQLSTEAKTRKKGLLDSKKDALIQSIKEAADDVKAMKDEVAEDQKQLQLAGQTRQKENVEFQAGVDEQKKTQVLLKKAVKVLSGVYGSTSLVQLRSHSVHKQPEEDLALGAPEGFKDYKQNSGGLGAVSLVEQIIADSQKVEAELTQAEQDSQTRYESFIEETAKNLKAKNGELDSRLKERAMAEGDMAETKQGILSTMNELSQLSETKLELHKGCDFIVQNFEVRQKARTEEIEALGKANGILGGAQFAEFLEKA